MRLLLLALLAGACLAVPTNEKRNLAVATQEVPEVETPEVEEPKETLVKKKGDSGTLDEEDEDRKRVYSTDDAADASDEMMRDGTMALNNLNMFYDCSGTSCKLVTGKGNNIGTQMPLKGDLELTRKITPTLDMMAASLSKIQAQNNMLANLQKEMATLNAISSKGATEFAPITNTKAQSANLMLAGASKGKGAANPLLMREASMCPMLKFEVEKGEKMQMELKRSLDGANAMAAISAAAKLKVEQDLRSTMLLREASKSEAAAAAAALMNEKGKNQLLSGALAKEMAEKNSVLAQKEQLERQLKAMQEAMLNEKMQKEQLQVELKKTQDEKSLCLTQLMMTNNALNNEKKEKENALNELAKTATELALTKNTLEVEVQMKKACEETLGATQIKLVECEATLAAEKESHANTRQELMETMTDLRSTRQELAVTDLRLKQTQAELTEKEQALARTQATLEATEEKLARTMATLEETREELRQTQIALEAEKIAKAQVERQLGQCEASLAATEAARLALEETKQKLEDELADTQAALLDMTAQKNQMENNFENAMKLLAEEKTAKAAVEAALQEANVMKAQLALQLQQALEMFAQAKKANEELNAMFEQVKAASALIQMQLEKLQLENIQLQAEVDKLKREQEAALALAAGCPPTYEKFSGSCYKYVREKTAWKPAQESCMRDGGNLVSIETLNEQKFVLDHLKRHGASQEDTHSFAGATRDPLTNLWKWTATGAIIGRDTPNLWYNNVQKEQEGADCMAMYLYDVEKIGKFASRPCEQSTTYVCEVNILPPSMSKPSMRELNYLNEHMGEMPRYLQSASMPMTKGQPLYNSGKGNSMLESNNKGLMAAFMSKGQPMINTKSVNTLAAQLAQSNKIMRAAMAMTKASNIVPVLPKGNTAPFSEAQMAALLAAATKGEE